MKKFLMFDVESLGLHGTAFAVGAVVCTEKGEEIATFELLSQEGLKAAQKLAEVEQQQAETPYNRFFTNMLPKLSDMPTCETNKELRKEFYHFMKEWIDEGAEIWSDCNFPVETNFLTSIVNDFSEEERNTYMAITMPYPLYDLSNFMNVNISRTENGLPFPVRAHNPLDDSKASMYHLLGVSKPF